MANRKKDTMAANAALGLISPGSETHTQAIRRRQWERRFAPLGLALPDETPPDDLWFKIQATLDKTEHQKVLGHLRRSRDRWCFFGITMALMAAGLAYLVWQQGYFQS